MRALVLEEKGRLALRDIALKTEPGPGEVAIDIDTVGICGSDVHYYTHGRIGPFVVEAPMVLGHEAAGTVAALGKGVTSLKVGDRVCMEPGIPDPTSRASRLGLYNVDPAVRFWATPPVHGVLTPRVTHPVSFCYRLPDHVSFAEGAMVEPFAIGMQAAAQAGIRPGDTAAVIGAGPIGIMVALAALAGGCARVLIADLAPDKLAIAAAYDGIEAVDIRARPLAEAVSSATDGWGADIVFECSGAAPAYATMFEALRPGGTAVLVGLPVAPVPFDTNAAIAREATIRTVFRYANVFGRAVDLIAAGKVDLKLLISATFPFAESVTAFERAAEGRPTDVKLQIRL
ncbi:NAD(P)-dependent alcohol dehydrogenase [Pseudoroseicyclus sp. CXY001]|uniref:NAD(P)-dependent alcohol dehydrogenase n=1 Tax=Pseudoroseicyclus sp. CXY001 TaxID=3242492 RepID=UPI00358DC6E8